MPRYEVQFRSSGIVAFSASERAICQYWLECNDYEPETPCTDLETGELLWSKGDCLNLFVIKRVSA